MKDVLIVVFLLEEKNGILNKMQIIKDEKNQYMFDFRFDYRSFIELKVRPLIEKQEISTSHAVVILTEIRRFSKKNPAVIEERLNQLIKNIKEK